MPRYHLTNPDGNQFEVDAPEGATEQDAIDYVMKNNARPIVEKPKDIFPKEKGALTRFFSGVGGNTLKAVGAAADAYNMLSGQSSPSIGDLVMESPKSGVLGEIRKWSKRGLSDATTENDANEFTAGDVGKFIGDAAPYIAMPTTSIPKMMAQSAILTSGDVAERGGAALMSGGLGALGKAIGGFKPSEEAKKYMQEGIVPSVGQGISQENLLGRMIRRLEEGSKSTLLIGQASDYARERARKEWLGHMNKIAELPEQGITAAGKIGYEGITNLNKGFRDAYEKILNGNDINIGDGFSSIISNAIAENPANKGIIQKELSVLVKPKSRAIIDSQQKIQDAQAQKLHDISMALIEKGGVYKKSMSAAEKFQGKDLQQTGYEIRKYLNESLPENAGQALKNIDEKYGGYKTLESAASDMRALGGEYNATQLIKAIRAADQSKGKGAFGRGKARFQDDAESAAKVFGDTLGESGTTPRAIVSEALKGNFPLMAAGYANPAALSAIPLGIIGAARPIQKALLGGYDEKQKAISDALTRMSPISGKLLYGSGNDN